MFTIRNYSSEESKDIGKLLNFVDDCYDLLNAPFLNKFIELPISGTYSVNNGYRNLDQISQDYYKSPYYTYYIMYFNNLLTETLPENTVLNMFSLDDFNSLYQQLSMGVII